MKVAKTGDAPQVFGHWREEEPTLSKAERVGHPRRLFYYASLIYLK
jgi:hypothetical protein